MTTEYICTTTNPEETFAIGKEISKLLQPGDMIILSGDLGAGKTQFTKGLAQGLGVTETVTSPSFILRNDYEGTSINLTHIDVYRLGSIHDLDVLELDDDTQNRVVVVEWGGGLHEYLKTACLHITITLPPFDSAHQDDMQRTITITPYGSRWDHDLDTLATICKN